MKEQNPRQELYNNSRKFNSLYLKLYFSPSLDEDILQNKQNGEDIHRRGNALKIAAQHIQHHIGNHTQEDTVRD